MTPAPRRVLDRIVRRCLVGGTLGLIAAAVTGCRAVTLAYGPDAAAARANAEAVASAMEQRFTRVVRAPKFLNARMRIARYVFAPSKLYADTALWTDERTVRSGAYRELEIAAGLAGGQYTFTARPRVPPPSRTGDSRHFITLTQLDTDDNWRWTTSVEHAMGSLPPARAGDVMRALFASAEHPSAVVRADYRAAFPRSAEAWGRMFALDSINTAAQADGSTLVTLHVLTTDDRLRSGFPELAKYVRKYLAPARFHFRLADRSGATWMDITADRSRTVLRFRSHDGELQPLLGPARRLPDTLALHVDASAKLGFFTVGVSKLTGEFVFVNTVGERAWAMRFTKEPEWDLPLLTEQLLHSPLRRPFDGEGVLFRLGLIAGSDGTTRLARSATVAVNESAIMRFLGNLGFTAMSDYAGRVEEEENRFLAEGFAAMRVDVGALR
jgi:hypothetical protein